MDMAIADRVSAVSVLLASIPPTELARRLATVSDEDRALVMRVLSPKSRARVADAAGDISLDAGIRVRLSRVVDALARVEGAPSAASH